MSRTGRIIFGTFIDAPTPHELRVRQNAACVISPEGVIVEITVLAGVTQADFIKRHGDIPHDAFSKFQFICPGVIDCHIHGPQYKQLGTKTDVPLMVWLDKYTFPAEAAFADIAHAKTIYSALINRLLRNGTTTAVLYGTNHLEATKILADICSEAGLRAFVGKTCADQLTPDYYVETLENSLKDTESFIQYTREKWGTDREAMIQPVITPRFVPTCSMALLRGLGDLARKYDCYSQSHAAESVDEEALVQSMCNDRDVSIFKETGLLRDKCILAHCCRLTDEEARVIARHNAAICSCPYSNILFARAVVPVTRYNREIPDLRIGMGTDIAGGWSSSLWQNMRLAVLQDRIDNFAAVNRGEADDVEEVKEADWTVDFKYAYHLATVGGARTLHMDDMIGTLDVGKKFDAIMVDANVNNQAFDCYGDETAVELFEKFVTTGDDRNIKRVWINGKEVL